jgi:hypothetical protein
MDSIKKKINNITIEINYKTELLGIIMLISNYYEKFPWLFKDFNKNYTNEIRKKFLTFKDEKIIKDYEYFVNKYHFCYDGPLSLFLQLDEDFNCNQFNDYILKERIDNDQKIYSFANEIHDFAQKINFEKYYNDNLVKYSLYINSIYNLLKNSNMANFMLSYYGYGKDKKFYVNLIPFTTDGCYSVTIKDRVYCSLSVQEKFINNYNLYNIIDDDNDFILIILHEFSHGYINELTNKFNLINDKTTIFDKIKEQMSKMAYGDNKTIINEHIIRCIVARFIKINYQNEELYEQERQKNINLGFIYFDNIIESLKEYEENRQKYPTFDLFYSKLINNLKEYICK